MILDIDKSFKCTTNKICIAFVSKPPLVHHCGWSNCWTIFDKAVYSARYSHTYFITHPIGSMYKKKQKFKPSI